jgi:hypothetical protein
VDSPLVGHQPFLEGSVEAEKESCPLATMGDLEAEQDFAVPEETDTGAE